MSRNSFGLLLIFAGMSVWGYGGHLFNQMLRVVKKLAPPKTNRPFKNLFEAGNRWRVRREYQRLFPKQARKKFLIIRVTTVAGIVLIFLGIFLTR